jgi:hypothetical protein
VCGAAAFVIALPIASSFVHFGPREIAGLEAALFLVPIALSIVFPPACALLVFRSVRWMLRRAGNPDGKLPAASASVPTPRWKRTSHYVFLALFLLTWLFGAPAVQSSLHERAIRYYLEAQEQGRGFENRAIAPYVMTAVCFPVFPGILVSYHEYQVGPLWGSGGWYVHVWYVAGTKSFLFVQGWIS